MTTLYRLRQGVRAIIGFAQEVDYTLPQQVLSPSLLAAFKQLKRSEQLHSIRVLKAVLAQETDTPHDLAVAALMHDSGKIRYPLSVYGKTVAVLARKLLPPLYRFGSEQDPQTATWSRPFVVAEYHPMWSADILRAADAPQRAIWLVEHHQEPVAEWMEHPYATLLWRLQQADDTN